MRQPGPGRSIGMPAEKSKDMGAAVRRLLGRMAPERPRLIAVVALAVTSVTLAVLGPKLLGHATDIIVSGVVDSQNGIDFTELHHVLEWAVLLYVGSSVLQYLQARILAGVVQRTMYAHARRRRGQDQPPAARLRRPPTARRPAEPRHQRHRQRRPEPSADAQPAAHVAAHARRRARDDGHHLAAAGARRAREHPAVAPDGAGDRERGHGRASSSSGSTPVHSTPRWRRRSPATPSSRRSAVSRRPRTASSPRTTSCTTPASRRSSCPGSSSRS